MEQKPKAIPNTNKTVGVYFTDPDCRILSQSKVAVDEMLVSVVWFYTEHVYSICTGIYLIIFLPLRYIYIFYGRSERERRERDRQVSVWTWRRSGGIVQICTEITLLIIALYTSCFCPSPSFKDKTSVCGLFFLSCDKNDLEMKMKSISVSLIVWVFFFLKQVLLKVQRQQVGVYLHLLLTVTLRNTRFLRTDTVYHFPSLISCLYFCMSLILCLHPFTSVSPFTWIRDRMWYVFHFLFSSVHHFKRTRENIVCLGGIETGWKCHGESVSPVSRPAFPRQSTLLWVFTQKYAKRAASLFPTNKDTDEPECVHVNFSSVYSVTERDQRCPWDLRWWPEIPPVWKHNAMVMPY